MKFEEPPQRPLPEEKNDAELAPGADNIKERADRAYELKKDLDSLMLPILKEVILERYEGHKDITKDEIYDEWVRTFNKAFRYNHYTGEVDEYMNFVEYLKNDVKGSSDPGTLMSLLDKGGRPLQEAIMKFIKAKGNLLLHL